MPRVPIPPPPQPRPGLVIEVQWGKSDVLFDRYSVSRVNSRSFYVHHDGATERHLVVEWSAWLDARFAEGRILIDGRRVASPRPTTPVEPIDLAARDARLVRGAREVLKTYRLERTDGNGVTEVAVSRGRSAWTVRLRPDWSVPPVCSCPDAIHGHNRGVCKHVVACCLRFDDLRCQLLDVLV